MHFLWKLSIWRNCETTPSKYMFIISFKKNTCTSHIFRGCCGVYIKLQGKIPWQNFTLSTIHKIEKTQNTQSNDKREIKCSKLTVFSFFFVLCQFHISQIKLNMDLKFIYMVEHHHAFTRVIFCWRFFFSKN